MNAHLSLRLEHSGGRTRMRVEQQQPPWRVIRAFPREDGSALVHLNNVSGGVLAGDQLRLTIHAGPGSMAQITSTGATRLYRHRAGSPPSTQRTEIRVEEGAVLEYLPDPLIPFAGARHSQDTRVMLARDAAFFWWETVAPGRQAMGERFAFGRLQIRSEIRDAARPLLLEHFVLEPELRPLDAEARLGPYTHMANFYACKPGVSAAKWRELEQQLNEFCSARSRAGCNIWGATTLVADGIAVRGLSVSARELPATLSACWKMARRYLTGTEAVIPRKVY